MPLAADLCVSVRRRTGAAHGIIHSCTVHVYVRREMQSENDVVQYITVNGIEMNVRYDVFYLFWPDFDQSVAFTSQLTSTKYYLMSF